MELQQTEERKRKFLLVLPVLVLPFIALLFYSLGGGKGKDEPVKIQSSALSTTLPDPMFDNRPMDKMSLYNRAEEDSLERQRQADNDPFGEWMPHNDTLPFNNSKTIPFADKSPYSYSPTMPIGEPGGRSNTIIKKSPEEKVERKIAELEKMLKAVDTPVISSPPGKPSTATNPEIERLEGMMQQLSGGQPAKADPELSQMDGMLDKILDIQYPDRLKNKIREQSEQHKGVVYAVTTDPESDSYHILATSKHKKQLSANRYLLNKENRFYGNDNALATSVNQNAIAATVHETQLLVSGSTIKIRLEQNAYLQGQLISKGSFVFGNCSLNGERLQITIKSVRVGNSIFPVSLAAYDMDGLPGVRVPGSINRDATKDGTQQAIQTLSMGAMDPSVGAQAASAGIEAAKNLLTKKVKLIKVTVKAGYPILLITENQ